MISSIKDGSDHFTHDSIHQTLSPSSPTTEDSPSGLSSTPLPTFGDSSSSHASEDGLDDPPSLRVNIAATSSLSYVNVAAETKFNRMGLECVPLQCTSEANCGLSDVAECHRNETAASSNSEVNLPGTVLVRPHSPPLESTGTPAVVGSSLLTRPQNAPVRTCDLSVSRSRWERIQGIRLLFRDLYAPLFHPIHKSSSLGAGVLADPASLAYPRMAYAGSQRPNQSFSSLPRGRSQPLAHQLAGCTENSAAASRRGAQIVTGEANGRQLAASTVSKLGLTLKVFKYGAGKQKLAIVGSRAESSINDDEDEKGCGTEDEGTD